MIWSDIPGWFDWENIYDDWAARATNESVIVEIGVWRGRSLAYLATKIGELGKFPNVFGIDSWLPSEIPQLKEYQNEIPGGAASVLFEATFNLWECDPGGVVSLITSDSPPAAAGFTGVDFCFIDGDHYYESVDADLRAWWPKMRAGGQMAGHDYTDNWPGVWGAVDNFFDGRRPVRQNGNCWVVDV